jgi:hypothetical protein
LLCGQRVANTKEICIDSGNNGSTSASRLLRWERTLVAIISGLSDPAKVIASSNVTLTGGIVALGKVNDSASLSSSWSPGLRILPDYDLLIGNKIPPVTPNIIDVRIVRQQVVADFPSVSQKTGN